MGQFLNIYGFLAVVLRAATITFQSLIIGGVLFLYAVLGRWRAEKSSEPRSHMRAAASTSWHWARLSRNWSTFVANRLS